ncbi:MAG: 30S ribosomal protein S10 [Brevinemataceae bacterium]
MVNRIRVRLKAYDTALIEQSAVSIVESVKSKGGRIAGPIYLPTHIKKYTVLRSPHVDKNSREQFEVRTHKRLIDIFEPTAELINALSELQLPAGVEVEIKQ